MDSKRLSQDFSNACFDTNTIAELEKALADYALGNYSDCDGDIDEWETEVDIYSEEKEEDVPTIVRMSRSQWLWAIREAIESMSSKR